MNRSKNLKRTIRNRILVLCEGETERNYFQSIKEDPDFKTILSALNPQVITAKNPTPEQVVQEAIRRREEERKDENPYKEISELRKYYPNYEKAQQNDFAFLKPHLLTALENAEWLRNQILEPEIHITDCNPWVDVDVLVRKLLGIKS